MYSLTLSPLGIFKIMRYPYQSRFINILHPQRWVCALLISSANTVQAESIWGSNEGPSLVNKDGAHLTRKNWETPKWHRGRETAKGSSSSPSSWKFYKNHSRLVVKFHIHYQLFKKKKIFQIWKYGYSSTHRSYCKLHILLVLRTWNLHRYLKWPCTIRKRLPLLNTYYIARF